MNCQGWCTCPFVHWLHMMVQGRERYLSWTIFCMIAPVEGSQSAFTWKRNTISQISFFLAKAIRKILVYLFCKTFDGWSSSSPSKDFIALQLIFRLKISNIKSIYSSPIINLTIPTTHIWQNTSIQPYPLIPTRQSWQTHISWVSGVGSK